MKQPLILLVNDDRAVLDALEAAIAPTFEEIARTAELGRLGEVMHRD